jgi:hypothetical protein
VRLVRLVLLVLLLVLLQVYCHHPRTTDDLPTLTSPAVLLQLVGKAGSS